MQSSLITLFSYAFALSLAFLILLIILFRMNRIQGRSLKPVVYLMGFFLFVLIASTIGLAVAYNV